MAEADVVVVEVADAKFAAAIALVGELVVAGGAVGVQIGEQGVDVIGPKIRVPQAGRDGPARATWAGSLAYLSMMCIWSWAMMMKFGGSP